MSQTSVTAQTQRGFLSLLGRQAILFPVTFIAGVVLARLLSPTDFGTFATVSFLVMGLSAFFELGLGAVLIQQQDEPTPLEMRTVFTAYFLLFLFLNALAFAVAPWLAALFRLAPNDTWLLRAMSLQMSLGVFGSISTLMMERKLRFREFARLDVLTIFLDRGICVFLAATDWGAASFVLASLVSSFFRMAMLWLLEPWPFGFALDRQVLRRVLGQGAYFQGINLVTMARDNANALLGGTLFGPRAVGLLNWGFNLPNTTSNIFVQIASRVSFPAFARLQHDARERGELLAGTLAALNYATLPMLATLIVLGSPIVAHVYGEAWRPALPALTFFALRMMGHNVVTPLWGYLNASGRVSESFRIMTFWTVLEWALALALIPIFGFLGIAVAASLGVLLPLVWLLRKIHAEEPLPFGRIFALPMGVAALVALTAFALRPFISSLPGLLAVLVLAGGMTVGFTVFLERAWIREKVGAWRARRAHPEHQSAA